MEPLFIHSFFLVSVALATVAEDAWEFCWSRLFARDSVHYGKQPDRLAA